VFFTYLYRELRRRHRQAIFTALGLALGVCLVVTVAATASGVRDAQGQVLHSLYGVGTDITVTQRAQPGAGGPMQFGMNPGEDQKQGQKFSRDRVTTSMGLSLVSTDKVTTIKGLGGVGSAVGGLLLNSVHMSGKFAMVPGGGQAPSGQSGQGSSSTTTTPTTAPSQAPINISSSSIAGVDVTDQSIGPLSSTTIASGRTFGAEETNARVIVVDATYAKQKKLVVGDTMKIGGLTYKIVGLSTSASPVADVYMPLQRAQTLAGAKGKVNEIYVKAASSTQISQVQKEIKATMSGATVTTAQDLAKQVSGSLSSASSLANRLGKWLAVAALIAAVAVASLLTLSTVSRRVREFGTLKALGWRSRRIVSQVLGESFVVGVAGGVAGIVLGLVATRLIAHFTPALQATVGTVGAPSLAGGGPAGGSGGPFADIARQLSHTVTVSLHAPISPSLLVVALALAIGGGLVAGAFGGWRAARLSPADALRRVD
jgi:ABC-type antimicrobial peptide transport system permease subunit